MCRVARELKKEANMSKLQHVNIVALFAIVFELGHYGLVMEDVLYGALKDFLLNYDVRSLVCRLFICAHLFLVKL